MTCQPSTGPCMKRSEKRRKEEEGWGGGEGKRGNENACGNFSLFPPLPLAPSCPYFSYKHGTTRFHFDLTLSNSFVPLAQNGSFEHPTRREQSEGKLSLVSSFVLPLPTLFLAALRGLDDSLPFFLSPFPSFLSKFLSTRTNSLISLNDSAHFGAKMYSFVIHLRSLNLSIQFAQFVEIGSHHPRIKRRFTTWILLTLKTFYDSVPKCDRIRVTNEIHPPRFTANWS